MRRRRCNFFKCVGLCLAVYGTDSARGEVDVVREIEGWMGWGGSVLTTTPRWR